MFSAFRDESTGLIVSKAKLAENRYYYVYKNDDEALEMLNLLLGLSAETSSRVLRTTDGTGETPLHTLVSNDNSVSVVFARRLVEFDPRLLSRENAVGRTPAELARDRFVASKIEAPRLTTWWPDNNVTTLVHKAASEFVDWKAKKANPKAEVVDNVAKLWGICEDALAKLDELPKRRLVSLHEANDVAKRIGEQYTSDRYQFAINEDVEESDEKESDDDGEEAKGPLQQAQAKRRDLRGMDIVSRNSDLSKWVKMEDESKGDESSDEDEDME
jgi:hypothetical protein